MQKRGLFITFEGSEGCGKSTQVRRLAARLTARNQSFLVTREPGGTPIGEQIRHLLQYSKESHAMSAEAELLLFTASRAQLVRELIEPALAAGTTVLADRFLDSTTVYQGVARRLDPKAVKFVNDLAVGACRPDLTFVLDLDPAQAGERLLQRSDAVADRMEEQPRAFYEAVRNGYLQLAKAEPARIRVIDGAQTTDAIEEQIWGELAPRFD